MKILILNDFSTLHGGAEIATMQLRDGLRRRGHEAVVLSSAASPTGLVPAADIAYPEFPLYPATFSQALNFAARSAVGRVIADFHPDVVHLGMFLSRLSPLILPLLQTIPVVHHVHWLRTVCMTGTKTLPDGARCTQPPGLVCYQSGCVGFGEWLPWMLQMRLWRRWRDAVDRIVANCEATRTILEAEGFRNICVIPNGVAMRPARPPLTDPPTAFFAGRLDAAKGVEVLLKAWRTVAEAIPGAQLLVAGDGEERVRLERAAPPGTVFLGHLSAAGLDEAASRAWVQVVPSMFYDNFPLTALESMARGTAVIASDLGGLPEIVEPERTGRLVPPGDVAALAAALVDFLQHRERCETMGARARTRAQLLFNEDLSIDRFVRLYGEIAKIPNISR